MTHVEVDNSFVTTTGRVELNSDSIGYVESYNFSQANISEETRIAAITTIASVCYANPKALGSISLYDRLATENKGLPSSSYEFVPVLINIADIQQIHNISGKTYEWELAVLRYGQLVDKSQFVLTNLRALMADVGTNANQYFNNIEECQIIAKYFKVFKSKIDLSTARQFMRHRASWQELSRRYVSGKRADFEFYLTDKMQTIEFENTDTLVLDAKGIIQLCVYRYDTAISQGVKPEEARRILPQAMYTTVWSAWQPNQLDVFFKLRCDKHAQVEIQHLAYAMKDLLNDLTLSEGNLPYTNIQTLRNSNE